MLKKIFAVTFALLLFFSAVCRNVSAEAENCNAEAYIIMETNTGYITDEYNSNKRLPAGAVNKMMTLFIALEAIDEGIISPDMMLTASENAHSASGAVIWLDAGEKITVRDLLKGVIIGNANDAAIVLAEAVCGNTETFTELMNVRAVELGMNDTNFTSPGNTDDVNQYTTAHDVAVLQRNLSGRDSISEIMQTRLEYIREQKTELVNENIMAEKYDGYISGKAWHTSDSGYSVSVSAMRNGINFTAVVLGSDSKDERFDIVKNLLKKSFNGYRTIVPGFDVSDMKPVKVKYGTDRAVMINAENIIPAVVPKGKEQSLKTVIFMPEYIEAPVEKGQKIGSVAFYCEDTLLYETSLVTASSVSKNTFMQCFKKIMVKMFK